MPRPKQFCEEDVLKKAVELFWEKGFHATSMQDLVTHLGINRASLYDTFGDKEELFDRALDHYRKTAIEGMVQLFEREASVKEGFKRLFGNAVEETANDECRKGCFVVNVTTEMLPGNDKTLQVLRDNKNTIENLFITQVQKGIDSSELSSSKNAQEIGMMLFTLFSGIRVMGKVDSDPKKLQKVVKSGLSILD